VIVRGTWEVTWNAYQALLLIGVFSGRIRTRYSVWLTWVQSLSRAPGKSLLNERPGVSKSKVRPA